jgi:DNA excision repair protein ERCC-1
MSEDQYKPKPSKSGVGGGGIRVSSRQRGNTVLKSIRSVPWEFDDQIKPDYVIGQRACAVFLSVRYHTLNPNYIHERLKELGSGYELRILLVQGRQMRSLKYKNVHYRVFPSPL